MLSEHNRAVVTYELERVSLFEQTAAVTPPSSLPSVDVDRIYAVLDDPATNLAWYPIKRPVPVSPIAKLDSEQRFELRTTLLAATKDHNGPLRPYAPIVRMAHFVIAWIRWANDHGKNIDGPNRTLVYDVLLVARLLDSALDHFTLADGGADRIASRVEAAKRLEKSSTLLDLIDGLHGAGDDSPLIERVSDAHRAFLVELAGGQIPDDEPGPGFAASRQMREKLARVAALVAPTPIDGANPSIFTALHDALAGDYSETAVLKALDRVDLAVAGFHQGRAMGPPRSLDFLRISGAQGSPLADPELAKVIGVGFSKAGGLQQATNGAMDPAAKLSGNSPANFSAFFSKRFRANDWMWGRMDAAAGLTELLVRSKHLRSQADDTVLHAIHAALCPSDANQPANSRH